MSIKRLTTLLKLMGINYEPRDNSISEDVLDMGNFNIYDIIFNNINSLKKRLF